jgi:hypothetical protein
VNVPASPTVPRAPAPPQPGEAEPRPSSPRPSSPRPIATREAAGTGAAAGARGSKLRSTAFGVLSLGLHALVVLALVSPLAAKLAPVARAEPAPAQGVAWAGNTLDVELVLAGAEPVAGQGETVSQQAEATSVDALPAAPAVKPPATANAKEPPARPERAKVLDEAPHEPAPPPPRPPKAAPKEPTLVAAKPTNERPTPPFPTEAPPEPGAARTAGTKRHDGAAPSEGDGRRRGGQFGAEGKSTARDLGHAFARAIGPANQADAAWSKLPTGPFATLEIAIDVDETGKVGDVVALSPTPNAQLLSLARRTVILLRGGVFHLRGAEASAGRAVLRLRAEVSDLDASGAKVQGGTIDLAFSYEHGKGKAAFTREGGRHVEIFVTSLRNEPSQARSL